MHACMDEHIHRPMSATKLRLQIHLSYRKLLVLEEVISVGKRPICYSRKGSISQSSFKSKLSNLLCSLPPALFSLSFELCESTSLQTHPPRCFSSSRYTTIGGLTWSRGT